MQGNTECLSPCLLPLGFTMDIWFEWLLLGNDPTKGTLTTWQLQCSTYFPMSFHWCLKVWKLELEQRNHVYSLGMKNRQSDSAKIKSWCHLSPIPYLFPFLSLCSERSPLRNPTANSSLQNPSKMQEIRHFWQQPSWANLFMNQPWSRIIVAAEYYLRAKQLTASRGESSSVVGTSD